MNVSDGTPKPATAGVVGTTSTTAKMPVPVVLAPKPVAKSAPTSVAPSGVRVAAPQPARSSGGSGVALPSGGNSLLDQARLSVNNAIDPAIAALNDQLNAGNKQTANQIGQIKTDTTRQQGNATAIYDALKNSLTGLNNQEQQGWSNTQQAVGNNYAALNQKLADLYQGQSGGLSDKANALGIEQGLPNASQGLTDTSHLLQGLAGIDQAHTNSTLATEKQGFNTIGMNEAARATTTGQLRVSELANMSQKQINSLQNANNLTMDRLRSQMSTLKGEKAGKTQELYQKLQAQAAQLEQANRFKQADLALRQQAMQQSSAQAAQSNSLARERLTFAEQQFFGVPGKDGTPTGGRLQSNDANQQRTQDYNTYFEATGHTPSSTGAIKGYNAAQQLAGQYASDPNYGGGNPANAARLMSLLNEDYTAKGKSGVDYGSLTFPNTSVPGAVDKLLAREAQNTTAQRALGVDQSGLQALLANLYRTSIGKQ